MRALATYIQTMQVGQRRSDHFLQEVAEQQQQIQQELREPDALLRPRNALGEPIANRAENASGGGSIPENIVILYDSNDDNLIWDSPNSGG
jgi:hypothetical protein